MTVAYAYRPGVLYLNVTNRCTNDCTFCVRQGPGFSLGGIDMRLPEEPGVEEVLAAVAAADVARGEPYAEVVFCGFGEPTHRLALVGTVGRALRAEGRRVRLNTNGHAALIAGGDPWPDLDGALDHVSVSLNAPDAARYLEVSRPRPGLPAWEALLTFVREAVPRVDRVTCSVVGAVLTADEIQRCEALAEALGAELRVR